MDLAIFKRDLAAAGGAARGVWHDYDPLKHNQSLPERVRELAALQPDRRAVVDAVTTLSYSELDRGTNRVARAIAQSRGTRREAVLLLFDVGAPGVVASLGALAAGKFWVAVEPTFTPERMRQIADDAGAGAVLTDARHAAQARALSSDVLVTDELAGAGDEPVAVAVNPDDVALLNYTSGSTGRPKGVAQSHRSAMHQALRFVNAYHLGDGDCIVSTGSLAWAGSFWDMFGGLASGACLGAYDTRVHGIPRLAAWIGDAGATVLAATKTMVRLAMDFPDRRMAGVRLVQMGGDTVYRRDVLACQRAFPNAIVSVGLGTSEAGRVTQQFLEPGVDPRLEVVPIGFPLPGMRTFLAAEDGREPQAGEPGEIVAQSDDLAVGYWNLPDKTSERFRREPRYGGRRAYFTGDLGRDLGDGLLLHIGRRDFQVKVRGYQVPTGEVEGLLLQMPGVRDACVVGRALPDGNDQLIAFIVGAPDVAPAAEEMRTRLAAALPEHMVPQRIVAMDTLPKTPTGKTDRNALPYELAGRRPVSAPAIAPRTPFEATVAAIWREVLALDEVGVTDEFLALGGDSMRAMQVVSRVLRAFGVDLPMSAPLACRTVEQMAALIAGTMAADLGEAAWEGEARPSA